uniref:Phytanoyl-CoA dioxygenase n=1 Tax=Haptolina ericina TaxID=156174 RepID=A0A7S3EZG5_9EUKA
MPGSNPLDRLEGGIKLPIRPCCALFLLVSVSSSSFMVSCLTAALVCGFMSHCRNALASWRYARRQADIKRRVTERDRRVARWRAESLMPAALDCSACPRFNATDPAMLAHLEQHGFAIVREVASAAEVAHAKSLLWEFLEEQAGMQRADARTWTNANFLSVGDPVNGIVSGNGFGHSRFCWFLRTLPMVRCAFEHIWCTTDLITSFDGGNIFRPSGHGRSHRTNGGWWHVDQGRQKTGLHAVQGFVTLYDASSTTGGLCVVPGSHQVHADLMSYAAMNDQDYVAVPEPTINPTVRSGKLVSCKAGDLVLWDSRCIHCNTPRTEARLEEQASDELLRAVGYICLTPRRLASRYMLRMRRRAFAAGIGSSHWPHEFVPNAPSGCLERLDDAQVEQVLALADPAARALVG